MNRNPGGRRNLCSGAGYDGIFKNGRLRNVRMVSVRDYFGDTNY